MAHEYSERAQSLEAAGPSLLRFGTFEIDPERGEVRKSGVRIKLQEKPFQILSHLVGRAGSVVTREELRQHVWPADTFVDFDANLNTALNKLRQALGDSADNPAFIQTIPRRGYCFIAPVSASETPAPESVAVGNSIPAVAGASTEVSAALPLAAVRARRLPYAIFSVTLLLILSLGVYAFRPRLAASARPPAGRLMLLVMPFADLSAEHNQEYFADGLTDELISELTQFHPGKLGVIARTTAMQYKDNRKTVDQISRELGVDYLLEGSVRRSNGRVRISTRLIRTRDQSPLWAENYESDIADVLVVQHDVARLVSQSLPLGIDSGHPELGGTAATVTPAAYDAYLKGRYYWNKRTPEALMAGLHSFESAIHTDPGYAPAYAGLAESYQVLSDWMVIPSSQGYPKAQEAAKKALALDASLSSAEAVLAASAWEYDRDWALAEKKFLHIMEVAPRDPTAHQWYAEYLSAMGRKDEAVTEIRKALELDPLSLIINSVVGYTLYDARRYDEAIVALRKTLELDPNYYAAHMYLLWVYEVQGKFDEAVAEHVKMMSSSGAPIESIENLRHVYAAEGYPAVWRLMLGAASHNLAEHKYVPPYRIVNLHAQLGEREQALEWLDKSFRQRDVGIARIKVDPKLDSLRSDPRFREILARFHLS